MSINWDTDTYPTNDPIPGPARSEASWGTFDAVVDPTTKGPNGSGLNPVVGTRYLLIEDIADDADAWKNNDTSPFSANANDIIEWDGNTWYIVFEALVSADELIYQTNIFTLVQYKWNGVSWVKSFEGEYKRGEWRLEL